MSRSNPVNEASTLDRLTTAPTAYEYHIRDHRDPWLLRSCVYGTLFLTVSQTAIETYCGTYYFVQHWGQPGAISTPPKPLVFQTLFDGIVVFMVQFFFLWRIWIFVDNAALLQKKTENINIVWLTATAATDLFIAVYMLIILNNARSRISFSETRDILSKYTRLTIQTGSLTSCVALMVLLPRVLIKAGTLHTLGAYLLGKSAIDNPPSI
ncbi:hypothetical protein K439DRAFT_882161 [Ramaria rubella]|nr:hypothetical protein K439DRAFT_882161 [Ramaria rubella]